MMGKQMLSRSEFLSIAGGVALLSLSGEFSFAKGIAGNFIDTPKKRQKYSLEFLQKLCTHIGPRPSGSKAFAKGAKIIRKEMERSLPQVGYDSFFFEKWEMIGDPELVVDGQKIETVPRYGGNGTTEEGLSGMLKKTSTGFSIVDALNGQTKALLTVSQYGKAITGYQQKSDPASTPTFGIGKQDVPLLERSVQYKGEAWIKGQVRFVPQAKGLNIVGKLPGKVKDEILLIAHADTVFNSPGANDNAASVIIMLMLAHAAAKRVHNHTLTFVASDNEEYGLMGAKNYADHRIANHTMENIRYVINFDSLTYGPNLWISSRDAGVKDLIRDIHIDLDIRTSPIFDDKDGFVMDSAPFRTSGARALHANSRGYNEKTLPVYHRPDDNADNVPLDCVESSFLVFNEFIKRIDQG